jgi:hypothetical protein
MRVKICLALLLAIVAACPLHAQGTQSEQREKALAALREVAAARDLPQINVKIAEARKLQGDAAYDKELARLEELTTYSSRVWEHVDNVLKQVNDVKELMVGEQLVAIVEWDGTMLTLRVAGQDRTYTKAQMPGKLVLALAQLELRPEDAGNKVHFGAFLVLDGKGDKKLARQMWDEAAKLGTDVKRLLPELDVPPVPIGAQVPEMNVFLRNVLSDKNWMLRRKTAKGWAKQTNGEVVTQNDEGRLVIRAASSEKEPVQGVTTRRLAGDFLCRMVVQTAAKGSVVGLFSADGDDAAYTAPLPVGTFLVEISRVQGKVAFKVGERDVEPTADGMPGPRIPYVVGLVVPPGSEAIVTAIEFPTK